MPTYHLSLLREDAHPGEPYEFDALFGALWPMRGIISVNGAKQDLRTGVFLDRASRVEARGTPARWLRFALTAAPVDTAGLLKTAEVEVDGEQALLRLDTVTFPPGACAWRHVHAGAGIRHLLDGALRVTSDDHEMHVRAGDSWFEPAATPVRAMASLDHPRTGFVRCMILPTAYAATPTIRFLDDADAEKPRLQVTERHLDQIIHLPQG